MSKYKMIDRTDEELAFLKAFGMRVKELRKQQDLLQERFAWRKGLERSYFGQVERGKPNPSLLYVWKLMRALGTTFPEFFTSELFGPPGVQEAEDQPRKKNPP